MNGKCQCSDNYVFGITGQCIEKTELKNVSDTIIDYSTEINTSTPINTTTLVTTATPLTFNSDLKYDDENDDVTTVQKFLIKNKFLTAKKFGYFGVATKKAVQKFQKFKKLKVTGMIDEATRKVMNDEVKK